MRAYGPHSPSLAHQHHQVFPWWNDGSHSGKWICVWPLPGLQWHQTRLCTGPHTLQSHVHYHAVSALSATYAGITGRYRWNGRFFFLFVFCFNLRCLKAKIKVLEALVHDFLFADECALATLNKPDLQELVNRHQSLQKTEVLLQPGLAPSPLNIMIKGTKLNNMESFQYLRSAVMSTSSIDKEVSNRLAKAGGSSSRLWTWVREERGITVCTKLAVYKAVVVTSLLYGCESRKLYRKQLKTLHQFTFDAFARSWVPPGKIEPPTQKWCTEPTCQALRHWSSKHISSGLDMWFRWMTRPSQRWSSSLSWPLVHKTLDVN